MVKYVEKFHGQQTANGTYTDEAVYEYKQCKQTDVDL